MIRSLAKRCIYTAIALCAFMTTGCDGGYDCSIENVAYNRIGFYNIDEYNNESKYKFPEELTVSIMINGVETVAINHISDVSELQVPMSYTNECDTLIFNYQYGGTDSIFVTHENIPYFVSMECGTAMYHRIKEVRHTDAFIDSIAVVHDYINYNKHENIKLYLVQ